VQRGRRARRQKPLQEIRRLDSDTAQIFQPGATAFSVKFLNAPKQPLDADEISFRISPRVFNKKRGIAAPKLDFERLGFFENSRQIQRFND
jgi:hypothetical protein